MKPTLLVLAAGMGSRYGGLKQIDPMGPNGETVLDYSVFDAIRAGFDRVVFVIREDFEDEFRAKVGEKLANRIQVEYAFQRLDDLPEGFRPSVDRVKPWGTTHAVLAARDVIDAPFAVINADDFYGRDSYLSVVRYFDGLEDLSELHMSMVGYRLDNTLSDHGAVNRGICNLQRGNLQDVEEHVEIAREEDGIVRGLNLDGEKVGLNESDIVSMNFWGFSPAVFSPMMEHFTGFLEAKGAELKSECYIPTVVDDIIKSGLANCRVLDTDSSWFGMTYPEDKPKVMESITRLVESGEYPVI